MTDQNKQYRRCAKARLFSLSPIGVLGSRSPVGASKPSELRDRELPTEARYSAATHETFAGWV